MSVYTPVTREQLEDFLRTYPCGELLSFQGISAGIENTNYFVTTSEGEYVLTLFEMLTKSELPYFLNLMAYLAEHDVKSAHPIADQDGVYLRELEGKPTALVQRLNGRSVEAPEAEHCFQVGSALAKIHVLSDGFSRQRENERGAGWWADMQKKLLPHLNEQNSALLKDEMEEQSKCRYEGLPRGITHADLFRDNVLFDGPNLSGMIDFYYACTGVFLYDVAVTVNDWCSAEDGSLDEVRFAAMLAGYQTQRSFVDVESEAWPVMLRAAGLRFWLSRLHDKHFQREGEMTHIKDPDVFMQIIRHHRDNRDEIIKQWRSALVG